MKVEIEEKTSWCHENLKTIGKQLSTISIISAISSVSTQVYNAHYVQMVNHEKYSLCHQNYGLLPNLKQCSKGMLSQRKGKSRIVG